MTGEYTPGSTQEVSTITADTRPAQRRRRPAATDQREPVPQPAIPAGETPETPPQPARTRRPSLSRTSGFRTLGLGKPSLAAIAAMGFKQPTPIQAQGIPPMLAGRDLVGKAQTGTGKTLACALPIAERIDPASPATQAIVLVPTRELATQVAEETVRACASRDLRVVPIVGGRRIKDDLARLAAGAQIVVGTPGRVIDHLRRGTLRLDGVRIVVLDEADEMLDIGFADAIETILRRTPRTRQTALFSATMPPFIRRMVHRYLNDPVRVSIDPEEVTVTTIEQVYYEVSERDKLPGLLELLADPTMQRVLCFRRTQIGVDRLAADLHRRGVAACGIHGGMTQSERDRVMRAFKAGEIRVLIATNVAARGLDIQDVTHVVNYDLPQTTEEYVHRIGRTGRAGHAGTAVTFIAEWDYDGLEVLKRYLNGDLRRGLLQLYGGPGRVSA